MYYSDFLVKILIGWFWEGLFVSPDKSSVKYVYRKQGAIGCKKIMQFFSYYWLTVRHFVLAAPLRRRRMRQQVKIPGQQHGAFRSS